MLVPASDRRGLGTAKEHLSYAHQPAPRDDIAAAVAAYDSANPKRGCRATPRSAGPHVSI